MLEERHLNKQEIRERERICVGFGKRTRETVNSVLLILLLLSVGYRESLDSQQESRFWLGQASFERRQRVTSGQLKEVLESLRAISGAMYALSRHNCKRLRTGGAVKTVNQ